MAKTVVVRNVDVEFPYEPYQCQLDYMEKVMSALDSCSDAALESPTGTGKTLSLLCASLAWVKKRKGAILPSFEMSMQQTMGPKATLPVSLVPRIFYCSRTHSQLSQVVRELNKTMYIDVKVCTLGSRDQLCVHEQVSKEKDGRTKALKCRNLVAKRSCHYYNQWNGMDSAALDELYRKDNKVLDIEDLAKTAKSNKQCPFFRSRQQQETAELILLPYNYLIDPHLRQTHKIDLKGNIVIFDEAHNLESVCEDSVSAQISTADVAYVIKELQAGLEKLHERNEEIRMEMDESSAAFGDGMSKEKKKEKEIQLSEVANILEKLFLLEEKMDALWEEGQETEQMERVQEEGEKKVFSGRSMIEMLEAAGFRKENAVEYSALLHHVASFVAEERAEEGQVTIKEAGNKLLDFGSFLSRVFADSFEAVSQRGVTDKEVAGENFKVYAVKDQKKTTFHYWCMTAGIAMRFLKSRGVTSIIVTSGTLAPLEEFTKNLGIPFPYTLQNQHAAKAEQVSVLMVDKAADGSSLSGTFQARDSPSYLAGVGEGVARTVENTPDGVLVFFSSYALMNNCIANWKSSKGKDGVVIYDRIKRRKEVVVEPKERTGLNQARFNFNNAIATRGGAVFMAVCRGKVSEGIDFADTHSRAVVIIGIPFPPLFQPKVLMKRNYLNQQCVKDNKNQSGNSWYQMEGHRAVNQAIGRVLRHVDDYGVVVLLDARFCTAALSTFPRWVEKSLERVRSTEVIEEKLREFFRVFGGAKKQHSLPSAAAATGGSAAAEKRQRSSVLGNTRNTMEPQGIRDIAAQYTAAPVRMEEEEKKSTVIRKGVLGRAFGEESASSSSTVSATVPVKRPLPAKVGSLLDPATVATRPATQQPPAKKYKIMRNSRIEEEKSEEVQKPSKDQLKKMLIDANCTDSFKEAVQRFKESKDEKQLVNEMITMFTPGNVPVLRVASSVFDKSIRDQIKVQMNKKGYTY